MKTILIFLATFAVTQATTVTLSAGDVAAFLKAHNEVRAGLQLPPVAWNDTLADFATDYTGKCVFKHSHGPYGENMFTSGPLNTNATELAYKSAASWKSELANVDFPAWKCVSSSPTCGHYSQMVWKATNQIGCAIAQCGGKAGVLPNLVICEYIPRGNYIGQQPY
ncbi:uncharacterized protein LOC131951154 [Physella acuta]|uniref:uncharacterized protein LOC131951153 n=1 Tax=Physella acuta TaxID=109671 RepID=UPI0027DB4FBF|nr:uncharacterized protein LOC131951153 [Physella acuta]XP_059169431.1 uncharacterized protein LOC131951154 [Physella acuta]